jgi:hypothetical protein
MRWVGTWEDRFWSRVSEDPETGCWPWRGSMFGNGYGQYASSFTATAMAHRIAYELVVGAIPDGLVIDHLCRNRRCVNPAHLEPVTHRENLLRGDTLTAKNAAKTHCPQGHPYTGLNLYVTRAGRRHCRTCTRRRQDARRARLGS